MQAGLELQPGIVIHVIGWTGISPRINPLLIRVFIDGKCVGVLKDKHAETFPVSAGPHQVMVKRDFVRSETLDVSVPPGERAELECGVHYPITLWLISLAILFGPQVLTKVGLPVWLVIVVIGIGIVASGLYVGLCLWKAFTTGGYSLYLRPRAVPPMPSAEDAPPASATA